MDPRLQDNMQDGEGVEADSDICVSTPKRKLGDALSPESIQLETKVSEQSNVTTPVCKKRYMPGRKRKGLRPKTVVKVHKTKTKQTLVAKLANPTVTKAIDSWDEDNDDDYDTSDELPLSGLVRGESGHNDHNNDVDTETVPDTDIVGSKPKPKQKILKIAKRRAQNTNTQNIQSIMNALAIIQSDISSMKLDGGKRDMTLKTVDNSVTKLAADTMTKEELDQALTGLVMHVGTTLDTHKENLEKQDTCLRTHQKQLDDTAATLEVHDARLTSLEKDITDDLQHFKKRLEGLEYRLDKVIPPPTLLPVNTHELQKEDQTAVTYASVLKREERGVSTQLNTNPAHPRPNLLQSQPENKTIIIEGLTEYPLENLEEVVFELLSEIGVRMMDCDYNKLERLGRWNQARKWPRPIKLELMTTHKKNKILACKDYLWETADYYNVRLHPDEPKSVRVGRAMLRQLANKARYEGKAVQQSAANVVVDGVKYNLDNIHKLTAQNPPQSWRHGEGLKKDHPSVKPPLKQKALEKDAPPDDEHLKYAENLCTLDTPYGLAFFGIRSRFSNFYPCEITLNGRSYRSVEHGYQAEKAVYAGDHVRLTAILNAKTPLEAKQIGREVTVGVKWIHLKRSVMRKLLFAKFTQHPQLGEYLCSTKGNNLIEGSTDDYWGAGVPLHSKELLEGNWHGRNELGRLLISVREELLQGKEISSVDRNNIPNLITLDPLIKKPVETPYSRKAIEETETITLADDTSATPMIIDPELVDLLSPTLSTKGVTPTKQTAGCQTQTESLSPTTLPHRETDGQSEILRSLLNTVKNRGAQEENVAGPVPATPGPILSRAPPPLPPVLT